MRINRTAGTENHLIFPYDGDFFAGYGDFLEEVDKVANRYDLRDDERQGLFALCNLATHLNIMVLEESGLMEDTEAFMDDCHGTLPEAAASAFIEAVCNFHNNGMRPYGFEVLRQIEAEMQDGFAIMEVVPMREDDCMVVTVVNLSE